MQTDTTITITVEDIEELAARLEAEADTERAKLLRLIAAEARIVAQREPEAFPRRATERADADGSWGNQYPPDQVLKAHTGPRLFAIDTYSWEEIATSSGYYHSWRAVTADRGIYVDVKGQLWGADITGTGRVGQFNAHPGDCGVEMAIEWLRLDIEDVTTDALRTVERVLRAKAFPASVAEGGAE